MSAEKRKVVVIGAGSVGTTYVYSLIQTGLVAEIVLIDPNHKKVEGEIMDLSHGLPFIPPVQIRAGYYADCADAHLIVVTAGAKQTPGQSRLDLVRTNVRIVADIVQSIKSSDTNAVLVIVTNPVDVLTYAAVKQLDWPKSRIIGSGTVLDTSRFRFMLSRHCGIDPHNIHAYILGEHGDSEVPAWSMTHIAGISIKDYCKICGKCDSQKTYDRIGRQVRDSAYHIIDYKGSTYYAIGLALVRISQAILRNEHSVLTVSSLLSGEYDLHNICLSVPCVVGQTGVERIISAELTADEKKQLADSAKTLASVIEKVTT